LEINLNDKFNLLGSESRYFVITGGRGSGKSYSLNSFLLGLTYETGHVILFTRYTLTSASVSIIPEFIDKIETANLSHNFYITKDEIINRKTGSKILFKGIKTSSGTQTASLKSLAGVTTWVLDEAEELTDEETFEKIDFSIRTKGIHNRVLLVLNPATKEHFIYKKFFEDKGVQSGVNLIKGDTTYIHTTYLDNIDNLSESFINQIENIKNRRPEKYKHQILGGWLDKAEGVIFTNWTIGKYEQVGASVFGQDFGFSNDPTTLVECNIDTANKRIYINERFYLQALTTSQIHNLNKQHCLDSLIVADSAEPRLISELQSAGLNIVPAIKGQGSVTYGIALLQDYDLIISPESINLIKELNNYSWLEKKSNTPIDNHNHCFTGDTLITTIKGQVRIDKIKVGDLVLTSKGYKKVLVNFNNGVKNVNKYSMQFDTLVLSLCSTKEHKIKTINKWKQISQLQNQDRLFLYNGLTEKILNFTKTKNILVEEQQDCIVKFGNTIKGIFLKDTIFTTLMVTHKIITYQTSIWFLNLYIKGLQVKKELKTIQNGLKNFIQKELKQQKNGINQKLDCNGIKNKVKRLGIIENIKNIIAKYVIKNMKQDTEEFLNTAIITAKLKHFEQGESYKAQVYYLMIEDCHEYFANGILVHNCIDALRYAVGYQLENPNKGNYFIY